MKTAILDEQTPRTYLLVLDPGEEVMKCLLAFVKGRKPAAGHLTAIGAVSSAVPGYFDRETKDYKRIPPKTQFDSCPFWWAQAAGARACSSRERKGRESFSKTGL
jgi:hypothetical protein